MTTFEKTEELLSELTRAEKAQVLQRLAAEIGDAYPGIVSNPDVCGGEPCIVRTRIPVWLLVRAKLLGVNESEILRCYPTLCADDLVVAWGYYRSHRDEIEKQIQENEEA